MRLVLDTSTIVAALRSDVGASRQLLLGAFDKRFVWLMSVGLMFEYEAVLTRTDHMAAANVSFEDTATLLDEMSAIMEPVRLAFSWRPKLRDPNDDMVLETAINGRADAIVTFNLRDFRDGAKEFGISTLLPGEALRKLELH